MPRTGSGTLRSGSPSPSPSAPAVSAAAAPASAPVHDADAGDDAGGGEDATLWLPYSQVGGAWCEGDMPDGVRAQLGTFYQSLDTAAGLGRVRRARAGSA